MGMVRGRTSSRGAAHTAMGGGWGIGGDWRQVCCPERHRNSLQFAHPPTHAGCLLICPTSPMLLSNARQDAHTRTYKRLPHTHTRTLIHMYTHKVTDAHQSIHAWLPLSNIHKHTWRVQGTFSNLEGGGFFCDLLQGLP